MYQIVIRVPTMSEVVNKWYLLVVVGGGGGGGAVVVVMV